MHGVGSVNSLDARDGLYKQFGCTGWALLTVWMHIESSINGLDAQGGPYKQFGCTE